MKKYILIVLSVVAFSACDNFLEEEVTDFRTAENAMDTEESAAATVTGVIKSFMAYDYYSANFHQVLGFNSTLVGRRAGANSNRSLAQLTQTPSTDWVGQPYSACYSGIASANFVIKAADPDSEIESVRNARGLALFARGVHYFNLVRLYGRVPMVLVPFESEDDAAVPRAESEEIVYEQVREDLEEAFELMSEEQFDPTFPSKWAAKAFLAKLHLQLASMQNDAAHWTKARDYALEVINSGMYSLVNDYGALFSMDSEFTSESIFELAFAAVPDAGSAQANIMAPWSIVSSSGSGAWGRIVILRETYDRMLAACGGSPDARMEIGTQTRWLQKNGKTVVSYPRPKGETIDGVKATAYTQYPAFAKWIDGAALNNNTAGNNFIVCRLAEMYLIAAEAENEINGPTQAACDYLNVLLSRSRGTLGYDYPVDVTPGDFNSLGNFRDRIMDERLVELVGENHTWYDARRKGAAYFKTILENHNTRLDLAKTEKIFSAGSDEYFPTDEASVLRNLLLPIPSEVIINNQAIGPEDQNPGY
ncbi:MAG: RagB/SusD family nutrient uptake outer membrane protein [Marinilabiliaceae bacterium]|nr:RagB/SusD family nutrient uptake outer membrane protein [Marinilabiliaceae bacterium]